jgi:hypothetical protein
MSGTCEVIGWLVDNGVARAMVRDKNGATSLERVCVDGMADGMAIQTGTFRRGKPVIDRETQQFVGYEMERVSSDFAWNKVR